MTKRMILIIGLALVLLATLAMPVAAAQEGSVNGQFGISAAPTVDSVTLVQTALTPQTQYTITTVVGDADKISNLDTVVLKLWYDADGGTPIEGEFDAATADTQTCATVTWTHTSGTSSTTVLTPTGGGSSWSLGTYAVPTTAGHFDGTSFTFSFPITIGRVATETAGSAKWQVAVKATDDTAQTDWEKDGEGATMNWYGEINVPSTTVNWGGVSRGLGFGGTGSQKALGVTVTYRANGPYDEKVKSGATWSGASYTATLDATGTCDENNEFALKADDAAVIDAAVVVNTTGAIVDDSGGQTTESGDAVTNYNLWLKLASFFDSDNYQGTITFIVANGT